MKMFKRMLALVMALAMVFALAACSGGDKDKNNGTGSDNSLQAIKDRGVLRVGVKEDVPNFGMRNTSTNEIEGFEIDLAKAIGELTFLDVRFIKMKYTGIYAELDTSAFDCVISGIAISDTVDEVYDFSASYYTDENGNELAAVVKSGNNKLLNVLNKSIAILSNNGKLDELNEKWFPVEETTRGEE